MDSKISTLQDKQQKLLADGKIEEAFVVSLPTTESFPVSVLDSHVESFVRRLLHYYPHTQLSSSSCLADLSTRNSIVDLLSCQVCGKILEDPITLPCPEWSHTFCKTCLTAPTARTSCPVCHNHFPASFLAEANVSFVIQRLTEALFPQQVQAYRIRKEGNRLFKDGNFTEAVEKYTAALEKGGNDKIVFSNRSQAHLMLNEVAKALIDADQAIALDPTWSKACYRKAIALSKTDDTAGAIEATLRIMFVDREVHQTRELLVVLLRRFIRSFMSESAGNGPRGNKSARIEFDSEISRSSVISALTQLEKMTLSCKESLEQQILAGGRGLPKSHEVALVIAEVSPEKMEELLNCTLCYRILYNAVTPSCGHSFCKACLHRVLDFKPSCPECRQDLSGFLATRQFGSSVVIEKCAMLSLLKLYEERVTVHAAEIQSLSTVSDNVLEVAIFVLSTVWPGMPFSLHVFEPRYRLMMRQATESGSNLFGMCEYRERGASFASIGTMLKITAIDYSEDGRCFVETIGERRFRVLSRGMRDGYNTAKVQYIQDDPIPANRLALMIALQDEVYRKVQAWIDSHGRGYYNLSKIYENFGFLPPIADLSVYTFDGPKWIWWVAAVASTLGVDESGLLFDTPHVETRIRCLQDLFTSGAL